MGEKAACCCDDQPNQPSPDDSVASKADSNSFEQPSTTGSLSLPHLEPYVLTGFQALNEHVQLRAPPVKLYILYLALLN